MRRGIRSTSSPTAFMPRSSIFRSRMTRGSLSVSNSPPNGRRSSSLAAGVPVVVSDAGGLKEVIEHQISGTLTHAGDVNSLTWGILRVLNDPGYAAWTAANAVTRVQELFNWSRIAEYTELTYNRVWSEY